MRYFYRIVNGIADTCLAWFTPLWRRRGREAAGLLSRYIHHYRPQLSPERLEELCATRDALDEALLHWRQQDVVRLADRVREEYAALPGFSRKWWVEIVESLFVITVVFLGVRTYFVQPFRIPTNSMWPSLNGIVVHPIDTMPSLPRRLWDALTLGSSYVDIKADAPKRIVHISDRRKWILFTETILRFDDNTELRIPAASGAVTQYLRDAGKTIDTPRGIYYEHFKPGETIMRARVDAGDMVLVNRIAYHFRRPRRGETFVFDTRGINTSSSSMNDQSGGTHFIKRLVGLPGDTLSIESPQLLVNGRVAEAPGIARVAAAKPPYNSFGYVALNPYLKHDAYFTQGHSVSLSTSTPPRPWLREYLALGDNTINSLDSRYWGPVRQFNILGPASFTLWPFSWHWGAID